MPAWKKPVEVETVAMSVPFEVDTPEGVMAGRPGDVLIRGVEGELYPCSESVFEETYTKDESRVPRYTSADISSARRAFRSDTLDHVEPYVSDTDARSGVV